MLENHKLIILSVLLERDFAFDLFSCPWRVNGSIHELALSSDQ